MDAAVTLGQIPARTVLSADAVVCSPSNADSARSHGLLERHNDRSHRYSDLLHARLTYDAHRACRRSVCSSRPHAELRFLISRKVTA